MSRLLTVASALLRQVFIRRSILPPADHTLTPLHSDLFNPTQLTQHAHELAQSQAVTSLTGNVYLLLDRLDHAERMIHTTYRSLIVDLQQKRMITPAAEWLIDNMHIVVDQINEIRHDLPQGYYQALPKLAAGPLIGQPRVYAIAHDLIRHTDSRLDRSNILQFILDYQSVTPLSMGELWAVAIMLRFGLVVHLAQIAKRILSSCVVRNAADIWADRLLSEHPGVDVALSPALLELSKGHPELSATFGMQLLQRFRTYDGDQNVGSLITWLEQQPFIPYNNVEGLIHAEHQKQASHQAAIGNAITSMRTLNAIDWAEWFEQVSLVDHTLRQDPVNAYSASTFATRDSYRHAVEEIARYSGANELMVARRVIERSRAMFQIGDLRRAHIGYDLVDAGRLAVEVEFDYHPPPFQIVQRLILKHPEAWYLSTLALGTAAGVGVGLRLLKKQQHSQQLLLSLLLSLPASAIAKELLDRGVATLLPPRRLPRLDFEQGIPAELRTMVVIPTLLLTHESVHGQIAGLEVLALANSDPHLHFAILSDCADAPAPEMPDDAGLLALATAGVERLNERYGANRFFLLHRRRIWNKQQGCFMGWERKRGKLEEFNRLLIGDRSTTFEQMIGDLTILPQIRYVITLDSDTQLLRETAHELIGTLAHPLNQAVIDSTTGHVIAGYGILQPRIGIALPSAQRSHFAQIFSGYVGIDPYTTAVSDVYMDLFGEGIYAGKGIYDPHVLRTMLDQRFPENTLLSHDLIEGAYTRVGLLSDIELLDNYPATYAAYAARQHRWVRGDWQIGAWLLPWVPTATGLARNHLSLIARYKILDNLRRSLLAPAMIALLGLGWLDRASLVQALLVTSYTLLPLALPQLLDLVDALLVIAKGPDRQALLQTQGQRLRLGAVRFGLTIAFLPDQAAVNLDAIVRTLIRLTLLRRNLLEWETAAATNTRLNQSSRVLLERLAPFVVAASIVVLRRLQQIRTTWLVASPIVADWLAAPLFVHWLDQAPQHQNQPLTMSDQLMLRRLARSTWAYFAELVTEKGNYLAPDNFQETPSPLAALRTSPTNIGLQLLADLAAYDFGYIGRLELIERTEQVFATIEQLQHMQGHLLNWYDTVTLQPLPPAYISTVDSGNLAGALLTLRQGYLELLERPLFGLQMLLGLQDTLTLVIANQPNDLSANPPQVKQLIELLAETPITPTDYRLLLHKVVRTAEEITPDQLANRWLQQFILQAEGFLHDLDDTCTATLAARQQAIADQALAQVLAMDFRFLYDSHRKLFTIGHNVQENRHDASFYDLLASESRLASFIAIAKGDTPQEHWFHLSRTLIDSGAGTVLASWSGTMFEYLMPLLMMRNYPGTLLDNSYQAVVARQMQYGKQKQVPWGISESAYNIRDIAMNYQYRAFGVPGLGLKSDLGSDLVVAPYASMLALAIEPHAVIDNLMLFSSTGMLGDYGFYEAIDYSTERLPLGAQSAIIRSFMVHHQGMSLIAIANALHSNSMQRRFHTEALVQATETLLQEQATYATPLFQPADPTHARQTITDLVPAVRHLTTPTSPVPATHLLSNGSYTVMLTNAGGGYSSCDGIAITRWQSDPALDQAGSFYYIRDVRSDWAWSAAYQPIRHTPEAYHAIFSLEKVQFQQLVAGIETSIEIAVSPEENVEIRRIALTNRTSIPRELEVTSYAEILLTPANADAAHPAFSNLFIETEFIAELDALLASRRPRSAQASRPWALHVLAVRGHAGSVTEYETSRAAFIGRGHTTADPVALHNPLTQQSGVVLDPIFSLRRRVRIAPGGTAQLTFTTGIANSREEALRLVERYRDPEAAWRTIAMAWTESQVELRYLHISAADAQRFQRFTAPILYLDRLKRADPAILAKNRFGQSHLWAYGISGDEPIVLVEIKAGSDLALVREILQAHQYWRLKQLKVDLVLLSEEHTGYFQEAQDQILSLVRSSGSSAWLNQRGGVFVLRADLLAADDRVLLQTAARILLSTAIGGLLQHLNYRIAEPVATPLPILPAPADDSRGLEPIELRQVNPYGGFDQQGQFVIELLPDLVTPAPWSNVIANPQFGFLVTERGGGYTWAGNSREDRLTPWSNDPVSDPVGEALYLRDQTSGAIWSPTPAPAGAGHIRVTHGFGFTSFSSIRHGISSMLQLSVAKSDPVKIFRLLLKNETATERVLSATLYIEWVLGVFRAGMAPYIITEQDLQTKALFAHNPYHPDASQQIAFLACSEPNCRVSGDRVAFIGRNGSLRQPAGLKQQQLQGRLGAGLDPCGVIQCQISIGAGAEYEIVFLLGQAIDQASIQTLIEQYRIPANAKAAVAETEQWWLARLGQIRVETPNQALDLLLNGWLLYQTLACRIWARSAFYQSGGAYGFRDQLQDVLATLYTAPEISREQIIRAASRQFIEGDVQHWWHPPIGQGIRTRFSDDYLWLPFVLAQYLHVTQDHAILAEQIPFLAGRALAADEDEYYDLPTISAIHDSLYNHCIKAIDYSLSRMGPHGLPLIGTGDWNDGMNLVGHAGHGESIWVGWFLYTNLLQMAAIAITQGDEERSVQYHAEATRLQTALEEHGWDGEWYLRAYYDDGSPLGSSSNQEDQIDSIAQSWAIISQAADPTRARQALAAADQRLVDPEAKLIRLLTPPFNTSSADPGYIKGYVPGVRENGGQYTHAAIWMLWAYSMLGNGERLGQLLDLINPILHAQTNPLTYMVEPYVIAADVYSVAPHTGRGGWTWYTGSSGWFYRLGIEQLLGLRQVGNLLHIQPCIPPTWPGFQIWYRYGQTSYHILVENPQRSAHESPTPIMTIDGVTIPDLVIRLQDDGIEHSVRIIL